MIRSDFNELGEIRATLPATPPEHGPLPPEVAAWAEQNQGLILSMRQTLSITYGEGVTPEQIWGEIAAAHSPEWTTALATRDKAQAILDELYLPENRPLGPIGWATAGDELDVAHDSYNIALSNFTMIDEGLRLREDLGHLLEVLKVQAHTVDDSKETTAAVLKAAGLDI